MRIKASPSRRLVCQDLCICCTRNLRFHGNTIVNIFLQLDVLILCVNVQMLDVAHVYLREKLAKEPTLLLMIVGIPNVGKSALINTLFRNAPTTTKSGTGFVLQFICKFTCYNHKYSRVWQLFILWFPSPVVSEFSSCVKTSKVGTFTCYMHPPIVLLSKLWKELT